MKIVTEITVDPATARAHETFTEINHVLDHKTSFITLKRVEAI